MAKLGLIARADRTGLGYQTRAYYKHLKPEKTLVIDIQRLNGNEQHPEWYDNAIYSDGFPSQDTITDFLKGLDVVLTAETPYSFQIYSIAKRMGIKTICVENPEFYDHIKYPEYPLPDVMILPSNWMESEIRNHAEPRGVKVYQIHHPVDREEHPFRLRTTNKPMHIAGKPATNDRNGTWDYLQAWATGLVTTQSDELANLISKRYSQSRVIRNIKDQNDIYNYGDYLVLPRKYGGNCLILNEALSRGMPVIMPDIPPNNNILPADWLVPAQITDRFEPRTAIDIYTADPLKLHQKINDFLHVNMEIESQRADKIADTISWEALLPRYLEVINAN